MRSKTFASLALMASLRMPFFHCCHAGTNCLRHDVDLSPMMQRYKKRSKYYGITVMTPSKHTFTRFDVELDAIRDAVIQMGELVREQFKLAMESLNNGDKALMTRVLDLGYQVNSLEVEIDRKCNLVLAQRQPEAVDLRTILTVLKITTDLERIGDQAELIVRRTEMLFQQGGLNMPRPVNISHCAGLVLSMADNAMKAFAQSDASIATQVIRQDKKVNDEYSFITRNLISHMLEDPRSLSTGLGFLFVAKAIERIGDHAKNISEYVIFMVKGQDVRHTSIEDMERKAL
jgi:phosphate transport system protein